jgi:uncharacterized membrane protein
MHEKRARLDLRGAGTVLRAIVAGGLRCRRTLVPAAMAATALALAASPAAALAQGDKASGFIRIGATELPLPGGEWTVAGLGTQELSTPGIGAYGAIESAVLFLVRDSRVASILEINTNAIPVIDGWGRTRSCNPAGQLMLTTRYKTGWETSCMFVAPTEIGPDSPGPVAWDRAVAFAQRDKLAMADIWLTAGFRISDRKNLIDARYHFDPALVLGATAAQLDRPTAWTPAAVAADPLRQETVAIVTSWADGFDEHIERGLRNQIAGPAGALPGAAAYAGAAPHADAKLAALDRLYLGGQITWDDYVAQAAEATTEVPVMHKSLLPVAVEKNISFRIFGTFVDYAIAYVVTTNPLVSTGIALTINITDSVWFIGNDMYWDDYFSKLTNHNAERLVDFTYIGGEGAVSGHRDVARADARSLVAPAADSVVGQ